MKSTKTKIKDYKNLKKTYLVNESFDPNDCYHEFQNMYYPKEDKGYLYMGSHTNTLKGRRISSLEEVDKFMNEFSSEHCLKCRKRPCFVKEKRSGFYPELYYR
jgi:hypothetical protein